MKKIILGIMAIVLFSCNNKGSLQKYFVENSESSNFISLDVTPSIINTEKLTLSQKDKETLSFILEKEVKTNLYIDENDPNNYYFDFEFLN